MTVSRRSRPRRFQGRVPAIFLTSAIGAAILAGSAACDATAVGPVGPQWVGMCVDTVTGVRVDDYECGMPSLIYTDYYVDTYRYPSYSFGRVGTRVNITNITIKNPPAGSSRSTSLPSSGGTASSVRTSIAKTSSGSGGASSVKPGSSGTANSSGANGITRGGLGVKSSSGSGSGSSSRGGVSSGS